MNTRDTCTECGGTLTESDLREGPEFPEIGYVYYKCPKCEHRMPGPPDASPEEDAASFLPGDSDWRENPREYHDQMNLREAVCHIIDEEDNSDGARRNEVYSAAADKFALTEEETEEIVTNLMMSGRCYEPDDEYLKTL